MKFFTPTTLTTLLCTLSSLSSPASAIPADTKAVVKVGDKPDVEVFLNKRELAERTLNPTTTSSRAARADWRTKVVTTTTTTTPARQRPLWYTRTASSASTTTTQAPSFFPAPVSSTTTTLNPSTTPPVVAADNTPIASYSSPAASPVTTTTTTTTTPAAAPASTNGLNIRDVSVNEHNRFRALHGAGALAWDQKLADAAQSWASRCIWGHSQGAVGNYGENLASSAGQRGTSTDQLVLGLIKLWEDESVDYTPETPNYSHFTQMVWKSTTRIGCALVTCPAGSIFDARYGEASFLTCEYDPRGNVYPDENFRANVQP